MTETLQDDIADQIGALLDRLPPSRNAVDELDAVLAEAQSRVPWASLHTALLERVERFDTPRDRMALVVHATDLDIAGAAAGKRSLDGVFEVLVAAADAHGLEIYLERCRELLETQPALRGDLPSVARLIEIADEIDDQHGDTADGLITLAQLVEDAIEAEREAGAEPADA